MNTRAIAAKILAAVIRDKCSLTELFRQKIPSRLADRDQALVKEYCFGVLRWYHRLKIIADALIYKPIKPREQEIASLLLLGLYQLIYLQTPPHAAVSETVAAAQTLNKPWAKGLINQALHQFLNNSEVLLQKANATAVGEFSHPQWMIAAIKTAWPQHWQDILIGNNHHAPMFLRVNLQRNTREEYRERLLAQAIESEPVDDFPQALRLLQPQAVERLPGFKDGCCSVQDIASQFVAPLLDLHPGQRVLDACAAPGGKSGHILETAPDLLEFVAIDQDAERLNLVKDNIHRLKLPTNSQFLAVDAADTQKWWDGKLFDRILLDAPCSGTGVIRRHPDIKILRQNSDIAEYAEQQFALLSALWPLLKTNGRFIYTTCSIFPAENEHIISRFVEAYADAKALTIDIPLGVKHRIGRQLFPTINSHDGFYYALLIKG